MLHENGDGPGENRSRREYESAEVEAGGDAPGIVAPASAASTYPRCELCGQRAATEELLERHYLRRCPGFIQEWAA